MSALAMSALNGNGEGAGGSGLERGNRPKPLDLGPSGPSPPYGQGQRSSQSGESADGPAPLHEVLHLMAAIQTAVKNGALDPGLASLVFRLYHQLKLQGPQLEASHKADVSRVFVSLRQACCRDSGQLGTPCRLKIMELVELRAMGWRPNLAHSQYYHHQPPQPLSSAPNTPGAQPGPVSAPPFGSVPINPFGFPLPPVSHPAIPPHHILSQQQPHFHSIADLQGLQMLSGQGFPQAMQQVGGVGGPRPSYYLVPTQTFHPFLPGAGGAPQAPLHFPAPAPVVSSAGQMGLASAMSSGLPSGGLSSGAGPPAQTSPSSMARDAANTPADWPRGAVIRPSSKLPNPQRVPGKNQFRDEIVIRNADSGKIMGVKGRRVAVVENLTKTVISFQKVPTGAKERTLTLTANTEEELVYAKKMIEETIRRNVSPNRADDGTELCEGEVWSGDAGGAEAGPPPGPGQSVLESGLLRLHCDDPEMLAAAQEALADYFARGAPMRRSQTNVRSPAEVALRRERRKSMPSFSPETLGGGTAAEGGARADAHQDWRRPFLPAQERATTNSPATAVTGAGAALGGPQAKSTPDLTKPALPVSTPATNSVGRLGIRVVYTKDFLLKCLDSPLAVCAPGNLGQIEAEAGEILRPTPIRFSREEYQERRAVCQAAQAAQDEPLLA